MSSRTAVRLLAAGRVVLGGALLADPARAAAPWIGGDALQPGTGVALRALGARDLAIGLGSLATPAGPDARAWLLAGVAADATDLAATVAAGRELPARRLLVAALAGTATVAGLVLARDAG